MGIIKFSFSKRKKTLKLLSWAIINLATHLKREARISPPAKTPSMVVLSSTVTGQNHCTYIATCKPTPPSLLYLTSLYKPSRRKPKANGHKSFFVKSYREESSSISGLARKIIGAIPVVGLLARIVSDEGGVGGDIIDFAEFRRRVGNNCSVNDSRAFFDFQERRGKVYFCIRLRICSGVSSSTCLAV